MTFTFEVCVAADIIEKIVPPMTAASPVIVSHAAYSFGPCFFRAPHTERMTISPSRTA